MRASSERAAPILNVRRNFVTVHEHIRGADTAREGFEQ